MNECEFKMKQNPRAIVVEFDGDKKEILMNFKENK